MEKQKLTKAQQYILDKMKNGYVAFVNRDNVMLSNGEENEYIRRDVFYRLVETDPIFNNCSYWIY